MVPFGSLAFMPGQLIHTNEVTVLLGDNWFAKCSAKQAIGLVEHRKTHVQKALDDLHKVMNSFESKVEFIEMEKLGKESIVEIHEEFQNEDLEIKDLKSEGKHRQAHKPKENSKPKEVFVAELEDGDGAGDHRSSILTEEELWARLDELEQQEEMQDEIDRLSYTVDGNSEESSSSEEDKEKNVKPNIDEAPDWKNLLAEHENHDHEEAEHANHVRDAAEHANHVRDAAEHANHVRDAAEHVNHVCDAAEHVNHICDAAEHVNHVCDAAEHVNYVRDAAEHANHVCDAAEHANHVCDAAEHANHVCDAAEHANHVCDAAEHANHVCDAAEHANHVCDAAEHANHVCDAAEHANHVCDAAEHANHVCDAAEHANHVCDAAEHANHVCDAAEHANHVCDAAEHANHVCDAAEHANHVCDAAEHANHVCDAAEHANHVCDAAEHANHVCDAAEHANNEHKEASELIALSTHVNGLEHKHSHDYGEEEVTGDDDNVPTIHFLHTVEPKRVRINTGKNTTLKFSEKKEEAKRKRRNSTGNGNTTPELPNIKTPADIYRLFVDVVNGEYIPRKSILKSRSRENSVCSDTSESSTTEFEDRWCTLRSLSHEEAIHSDASECSILEEEENSFSKPFPLPSSFEAFSGTVVEKEPISPTLIPHCTIAHPVLPTIPEKKVSEEEGFVETSQEPPKRVSKFKAARMQQRK
ncbi:unconventional prefoldin RPB5 interactor 1 isoform X2 [Mustelus asterias]